MRIGNVNHPFVTEAKLGAMKGLVEGTLSGDVRDRNRLVEHLTTGDDSIFALTALTNLQVISLYDDPARERTWQKIAGVRTVDDFETPKLITLGDSSDVIKGNSRKGKDGEPDNPDHILPVVAEGAPYPTFRFNTEQATEGGALRKRGGRFDLSWERLISDPDNHIAALPGLITESFLEAEEWEVWSAFRTTVNNHKSDIGLKADQTALGVAVTANSKLTANALEVAIKQLRTRQYNGRPMRLEAGFKLLVPIGAREGIEQMLAFSNAIEQKIGDVTYAVPTGYNRFSSIVEIVESEYITGTEWAIIAAPQPGKRPGLELLKLRGHENPDIRLMLTGGQYIGGGQVGPFEGSFDTDGAAIRGRLPLRGVNWTADLTLYSDGTK